MRTLLFVLLATTTLSVAANAAATIPDYQPRVNTAARNAGPTRDANASMPVEQAAPAAPRFFEIPARR